MQQDRAPPRLCNWAQDRDIMQGTIALIKTTELVSVAGGWSGWERGLTAARGWVLGGMLRLGCEGDCPRSAFS